MKLFIDEDAGKRLAETLDQNGFCDEIDWVDKGRRVEPGTLDVDWMPIIGVEGWLVISSNTHMLTNRLETRLIVQHKMGIIFIPNQALAHEKLRLILNKEKWLEHLSSYEKRPFAWEITLVGRRLDRKGHLRRFSRLPVD